MRRMRALAATLATMIALAAMVGTSAASRLSNSSQTLRTTFARVNFAGGFGTVECAVTVEGSLHTRTVAKTAGALIGYITRAILGACARGSSTILQATLPWHVRYESFAGTLPAITRINTTVTGIGFQIREPTFGITCLSLATATDSYTREAGGAITIVTLGGTSPTNCGIEGTLSGTGNVTVLGAATRITVTLI